MILYNVSYVQVPFFGFRRKILRSDQELHRWSQTIGFMPYLTRASPILLVVTLHLLRYQLITRPLFQVGSLETSPRHLKL